MNPKHSTTQLQLDFTPGLTERYANILECVRACVYGNSKPLKRIAMDMDISQSDLSRKLANNPDDPRRFTVGDLESYVRATGDTTPILYLAQKYCADKEVARREALDALAIIVPQIQDLLKAASAP